MDYIVKNGISEYSILIPSLVSEKIKFASDELLNFILEATGCRMDVVCERTYCPVIELCVNNRTDDGFTIKTVNKDIIVQANSERGLVYGVYELCNQLFGLEFFTPNYYTLNKNDIIFKSLNISKIPDIPVRSLGIYPFHNETNGEAFLPDLLRFGLMGMAEEWGICGHTYFKILPPEKYKQAHPDWYSFGDEGKTLCLTNREMRKEFTKNLFKIVKENPTAKYFMIGQEDTTTFCTCPNCQKAFNEANRLFSPLMIDFTNSVVKEINDKLKLVNPDRQVMFIMFAYVYTMKPPVKKVGDEYVNQYKGELEKNIAVMLAPLHSQNDISYFHPDSHTTFTSSFSNEGANTRELLLGWRSVVDKLFFWSYHIDYADVFVPFNDWDVISENYKNYKKIGVHYLFEEGVYNNNVPNFNKLRAYVYSKMMWNVNLNPQELIDRFMKGYYGSIHKEVRQYFDFLVEHCRYITKEFGRPMLYVRFDDFDDLSSKKFWDKEVLEKAISLYKSALNKGTKEEKQRFADEGVPVMYLMLINYADEIDENIKKEYVNYILGLLERNGLNETVEGLAKGNFAKIRGY